MDINQLLENVDSLDFNYLIEDSFYDITSTLVEAQKDQLIHGYLSTGQKTGTYKIEAYALKKHAMNPLAGYGHKDYKLTGELQKEIFVSVHQGELVFGSFDPKFLRVLDQNDGDNIMGLNSKTISEQIEPKIQSVVVEKVKSNILK